MKASEAKLLAFIKKSPQFVIPIYQRTYSWSERECRQLWDDIMRSGGNDKIDTHFIGSIVYIEKGIHHISSLSPMLVIDGQQRLTSITLLIAALAEILDQLPDGEKEIIEGFSPKKLRNYYLLNPEEEGEKHYKLLLSKTDKDSLLAIVNEKPLPKEYSIKVVENYKLFKNWIKSNYNSLDSLCKGIAKLIVVDIGLNRDYDNPQLIFESMNSTGKELTQADLIRNYILMGLEIKKQTDLYEDYWRPMELEFGQEAYTSDFDGFMRHYLTVKTGKVPRIGEVYDAFKNFSLEQKKTGVDISEVVSHIRRFSKYYCNMTLNKESDKDLRYAFNDLKELKVDVAYPMLLELYDDFSNNIIDKSEMLEIVRLVEAYAFRRNICAIPTNSMNKTFSTFMRSVDKDKYVDSVKAQFILLPSYRRFPNDKEFAKEFHTKDVYNISRRSYWLKKLENFNRKESLDMNEYTIEHIMPQNPNLSDHWKGELGPEWERVHDTWLHTLGNLTLTGYNSEYGDKSFVYKRDMVNGYKDSPIRLSKTLRNINTWNEEEIINRGNLVSKEALKVWAFPDLPADTLDTFRAATKTKNSYTIDDYPFISENSSSYVPEIKALYDKLSKHILALDQVVTKEYLKNYIAFKAETNFVDIVPQSKRLRLSLNMPFSEVVDDKKICIDITNIGRWGNGDVEIHLSNESEITYVMGLIRQSFERQMNG